MRAGVVAAIFASASASTVLAAPRVVRGVVTAEDTGDGVAGATVFADRGGLAITDGDGAFALTVAAGDRELTITAPGYAARTVAITDVPLARIVLVAAKGSEVIEIRGKPPEQTRPLSYQLTADEIRFLPGAANDVLRAAQALPGVSRIPFSFGGLVLRGTSPRDSAIYLDGIEVPLAFHFGGITSFYPGTMLSDLTVTSGGFDASHGRAQGGLVRLTTREPRTDAWRSGGSIGLLDSSVFVEGPIASGGIIAGIRRSYLDAMLNPFVEDDVPLPSYWDVQVRTSFGDPRKRGRITPMLFASIDRVSNDELSVTSLFMRAAVPFTRAWGALTLRVVPWLGWTHLSFVEQRAGGQEDSIARPQIPGGVRSELVRDHGWGHVRGGVDLDSGYLAQTEIDVDDVRQRIGSTLAWTDVALWGETRVRLDGDRFAIKPGLRLDYYGISGELVVDPRINIHQRLAPWLTLRQALGRYHQPPLPADVDRERGNPALDSSYMDHASLGVDAELADRWLASVTSFASHGHDIPVPVQRGFDGDAPNVGGLGPTFELLLEKQLGLSQFRQNLGRARQAGLELLLKRSTERWFFLLSYTLAWAQRTDAPQRYLGWRPFELDQRHNLNIATSIMLTRWRVGARVQLVTGNPYSPTIRFGDVPEQDPFGGRLPAFFHLNLRADRRWQRPWGGINLYIDIMNVTNRRNVEGRDLSFDEQHPDGFDEDIPGLPIVPFIGVELVPN